VCACECVHVHVHVFDQVRAQASLTVPQLWTARPQYGPIFLTHRTRLSPPTAHTLPPGARPSASPRLVRLLFSAVLWSALAAAPLPPSSWLGPELCVCVCVCVCVRVCVRVCMCVCVMGLRSHLSGKDGGEEWVPAGSSGTKDSWDEKCFQPAHTCKH